MHSETIGLIDVHSDDNIKKDGKNYNISIPMEMLFPAIENILPSDESTESYSEDEDSEN